MLRRGFIPLLGGVALQGAPEGEGQAARRRDLAADDGGQGVASFLAGIPVQQDGLYLVSPAGQVEFPAGVHHHNHVFVVFEHALHQFVLTAGERIFSVTALRLRQPVEAQAHHHGGSLGQHLRLRGAQQFHLIALAHVQEAIGQGNALAILRIHPAGTASAGDDVGVGAQHGDGFLAGFERQQIAFVLQQHRTFQGHFIGALPGDGRVFGGRIGLQGIVQEAIGRKSLQDVLALVVQVRLRHHAVFQKGLHRLLVGDIIAGHLEVHAALYEAHSAVGGGPVTHHDALEAPGTQILLHQPGVFGRMHAVHQVVAGHHRRHIGLLHRLAEGGEIELVDGAFVGVGAGAVPVIFLVVQREVLDGGHHALLLDAVDIAGGRFPGQERILSEVFEITAAEGAAVDVHPGAQHDLHPVRPGGGADARPHLPHRLPVPGSRRGHAAGIEGALDVAAIHVADALGAVGHADGRDAQPGNGMGHEAVHLA